jgi:hypothetical protein
VRLFRRKVKGCSANIEAANRKMKDKLSIEVEKLDIESKTRMLNEKEKERLDQEGPWAFGL